ncbi:hypothetical protein [Candidatus Berkiella aquae]|uniref:Uncharacterized protein n=1 Tax=Candidatus Berkiella aquae TaxID=295108 RepID=A0A0Q9YSX3_9GAMM|nr:hypothetical protein [Candidatus Berkiella aquae]MCS5710163.1 hypothetical protein [Candidatus Berkiella aquae]
MTPQQVQFCYAIAHAQTERVRVLASKININQHNDCDNSPALMCLWALNRGPKALTQKLEELFPNIRNDDSNLVEASKEAMAATIRECVFPLLKRALNPLLKPIGLKVVSPDKINDHFIESSFAAVNVILNDEFFDDINAGQRSLAKNLFDKLCPRVERINTETKPTLQPKPAAGQQSKEQPYTIQLLMAILNGQAHEFPHMPSLNLQATFEAGRTYLPGASSLARKSMPMPCGLQKQREEEEHKYCHRMAPGVH